MGPGGNLQPVSSLIFYLVERELSNVHTFKEQLHSFVNEIWSPGQLAIRSKSLELGPEVGGRHLDNGEDRIDQSLMVSGIGLPTLQGFWFLSYGEKTFYFNLNF